MRVVIIGPSPRKSKGGMATVIRGILNDKKLNEEFDIGFYPSYIDGFMMLRAIYSTLAVAVFFFVGRNYDIYHIHLASRGSTIRKSIYARMAKNWGKKVILHMHGAEYMMFYDEMSCRMRQYVSRFLNSADAVVALSAEWKRQYDNTFGLKNCVSIENGVDLSIYSSCSCTLEECQHSFLALGRVGKRKGTYDIVNAVERIKPLVDDIMVYIAGDGETNEVKKMIVEKNLEKNVVVTGWIDVSRKIDLLSRVSTVLLPSYNEGLPMSILEGMAAGKAIICSNVGAIPEVISERNGILIEAGDIKALESAMLRMCNDNNLASEYGKRNQMDAKNRFSIEIMHEKIRRIYNDMAC